MVINKIIFSLICIFLLLCVIFSFNLNMNTVRYRKKFRKIISSNVISLGIPCIPKHIIHLEELIINIHEQELLPYEIIISLSETTKEDGVKLENKLNQISNINIRIITSNKKQYAGINRNICSKHCNTELISFIDSDDLMCPSRIKILEEVFNKYNYDVLYHNYTNNILNCSNNYTQISDKTQTKQEYNNNENKDKNEPSYLKNVAHGHMTMKTNILNKYPMDGGGYGEDARYLHTLFENDLNVISLPDYLGSVYIMENSSWL